MYFNYLTYSSMFLWFLVFAAFIVYCGFMLFVITNTVFALLFLLLVFLVTGLVLVFFDAEFLGLVFLIVYAGAIAILLLFVIMLLDLNKLVGGYVSASGLFLLFCFFLVATELVLFTMPINLLPFLIEPTYINNFDGITRAFFFVDPIVQIGFSLFNSFSFYILIGAFLLLVILIGIVALLRTSLRQVVVPSVLDDDPIWSYSQQLLLQDRLVLGQQQRF